MLFGVWVFAATLVALIAWWQRRASGVPRVARRFVFASILAVVAAGVVGFLPFDRTVVTEAPGFDGGNRRLVRHTADCGRPFFDRQGIFYLVGGEHGGAETQSRDRQPCLTSSGRRRTTLSSLTAAAVLLAIAGLVSGDRPRPAQGLREAAVALAGPLVLIGTWTLLFGFTSDEGYSCHSPVSTVIGRVREAPGGRVEAEGACGGEARVRLRLGAAVVTTGVVLPAMGIAAVHWSRRRAKAGPSG